MTTSFRAPEPGAIRWAATIRGGRELTLVGRADLRDWTDHLRPEGYTPFDAGGYAEVTIGATDLQWLGVQFTELVVSITVCDPQNPPSRLGYYLVQGWNSIRFFAYSERRFFSAPYQHGKTIVNTVPPAGMTLRVGGKERFRAELRTEAAGTEIIDEEWIGPIFLPGTRNRTGHFFMATLAGPVEHFDFDRGSDTVSIPSPTEIPVFGMLQSSAFQGVAWRLRTKALHRKSGTMIR